VSAEIPGEAYLFFGDKVDLIPIFEKLAACMSEKFPDATLRVQKSMLSWLDPTPFCYSAIRSRTKMMLSFSFAVQLDSPRIFAATEPYPGRWTHHVLVSSPEEIDGELMEMISMAHAFRRSLKRGN